MGLHPRTNPGVGKTFRPDPPFRIWNNSRSGNSGRGIQRANPQVDRSSKIYGTSSLLCWKISRTPDGYRNVPAKIVPPYLEKNLNCLPIPYAEMFHVSLVRGFSKSRFGDPPRSTAL